MATDVVASDMIRSEGAEMLHNRGYWVHRLPDGAYKITPNRVEFFQVIQFPPSWSAGAGLINYGWAT